MQKIYFLLILSTILNAQIITSLIYKDEMIHAELYGAMKESSGGFIQKNKNEYFITYPFNLEDCVTIFDYYNINMTRYDNNKNRVYFTFRQDKHNTLFFPNAPKKPYIRLPDGIIYFHLNKYRKNLTKEQKIKEIKRELKKLEDRK